MKPTTCTNFFSVKIIELLLCFILLFSLGELMGQDKNKSDSLESVYSSGTYAPEEELSILEKLAVYNPEPDKALAYSEQLLLRARQLDSLEYVIRAYTQKGNALRLKGDVSQALKNYLEGVEIASETNKNILLGKLYLSIADVYSIMDNRKNTILYYKKAIPFIKEEGNSIYYATVLENLGDEYNLNMAKPDSALLFFKQSGAIWKALENKQGMAYNLGNIGLAYAQKGDNDIAEKNITKAIAMLTELGDYYPICVYLTYMSDIYFEKGDVKAAFSYAERSLDLAQQYGLKDQISDADLKLSELYEKTGDMANSLRFYKNHIRYKDSVQNIRIVQQNADLEMSKKEVELDLSKQRTKTQQIINIAITVALSLIGLLAFGLFRRNNFIKRTNKIIQKEKDRSDSLLRNILPEETALELKENGRVEAKKFDSVTVLFTDFKGFTSLAEKLAPEELVKTVDFYFSKFDEIIEKYGLEKIKTVGDAYVCAGGLPFPTKDHAVKMVNAAFDIVNFVEEAKQTDALHMVSFEIRIGINSGPVVAGVVGIKKFAYDIWGDTVNVAARMETMSDAGRINISANTYELIGDYFECEPRGEIYVKNRGMMQMYFVNSIKTMS